MDDCLWDYISAGAKDCVRALLVVSWTFLCLMDQRPDT